MKKKEEKYYTVVNSPFVYAGYQCNNRCVFCFEAERFFPHKTKEQIKKEIRIIRKRFDFINFMGQEPTLRDDIVELIGSAKKRGFKEVGITTNGRLFAYPDFAERIIRSGLTQIVLTVAGSDAPTHDKHTLSKGSFKQALAGIKNILNYKPADFSLVINIMATNKNYRKIPKMVKFYADLGIKEINIGHVLPLNKKIVRSKEIVAKMSEVAPFLIDCHKKYGQEIRFLFVEYPACVFPEEYRQLSFPCLEENPQKKRIAFCRKCPYRDKCFGINKDYLNLYGEKEFKI